MPYLWVGAKKVPGDNYARLRLLALSSDELPDPAPPQTVTPPEMVRGGVYEAGEGLDLSRPASESTATPAAAGTYTPEIDRPLRRLVRRC